MKKILYSLFALLLCCPIAMAQTPLMSDEEHRIMMNDYATNLNTVLTANCPSGITIDQFKKKIVNGELTLSSTAQASILIYAEPLKTYGTQFATTKNISATTDAEKIFLSSFAPSAVIQDSKLIPDGILLGLTPYEMWECALNSFYTDQCGINAIVSDKSDIKGLTKACTTLLTQHAGNLGILVVINGFSECLDNHNNQLDVFNNISYSRLMSNSVLKQKLLEYGTNIQNNSNNELFVPAFGFSILTDSITYMGREATHSYTFRIKRQNQTGEQLDESLVLTKNNNKYQANLIQYRLSIEDEIAIYDNSLESIDIDLASKITVYGLPGEDKPCWNVTGTSGVCNFEGRHTIYDVLNGANCAGPPTVNIIWKQVPCANPPPVTTGDGGWITMHGSSSTGGSSTGGSPALGFGSSGVGAPSSAIPAGSLCLCCTQPGNPCKQIKPMSQFITPKISTKPVFLGAAYYTFKNNLNNEQRDWWDNNASIEIKNQIRDYLLFNRTADVDFAQQFVEQSTKNTDLNLDFNASMKSPFNVDTSVIDNTTTEGAKFNLVYNSLKNSPEFKRLFLDVFENDSRFNVKFQIGNVANSANGNTDTDLNKPTLNTITISPTFLNSANKMEIAKTIIHECIHAFLNVKMVDPSIGMSIPNLNNMEFCDVVNQQYNDFSPGQNQHNFIYNYMLPTMVTILSQVKDTLVSATDNTNINGTVVYPNAPNLTQSVNFDWNDCYLYLSLNGLQNCQFFQNEIGTYNTDGTPNTVINLIKINYVKQYKDRCRTNLP